MNKIKCEKKDMSQIWIDEEVVPVTILNILEDLEEAFEELEQGKKVDVSGISKGKGFQGTVKRHNFSKSPESHGGQRDARRSPGSVGATEPKRVFPGKKMAGRAGGKKVTVENLMIARLKPKEETVMVKGGVPGPKGGEVRIKL
ncbi:MAG: 50S ribosomal protein L3 [Candidatus Magasanikbacteria bacterium]